MKSPIKRKNLFSQRSKSHGRIAFLHSQNLEKLKLKAGQANMNNEEFKEKFMSGEIDTTVPQEMISDPMICQLGTILDDDEDSLISEEFALKTQSSMKSPRD